MPQERNELGRFVKGHTGYRSTLGKKLGPLSAEHKAKLLKANIGHPVSAETRRKISEGNKGKKVSEETRKRMSASARGRKSSVVARRKISESLKEYYKTHSGPTKGKHLSEKTKRKISKSLKGRVTTAEHRRRLSEARKGRCLSEETKRKLSVINKGKKLSEETRMKMSLAHRGSKSYLWRGGITDKPYAPGFTGALKAKIRERDHHRCQLCGRTDGEPGRRLSVHHMDYNKLDNSEENLVSLCIFCHAKTNQNRKRWQDYFFTRDFVRWLREGDNDFLVLEPAGTTEQFVFMPIGTFKEMVGEF